MSRGLIVMAFAALMGIGTVASAGAIGGGKWQADRVNGSSTDRYQVAFYGGEFAQVRVHSYGDTYVEVTISDEFGNVVATATDRSGDALLTWYVPSAGVYTIRVHNPSPFGNEYFISTN